MLNWILGFWFTTAWLTLTSTSLPNLIQVSGATRFSVFLMLGLLSTLVKQPYRKLLQIFLGMVWAVLHYGPEKPAECEVAKHLFAEPLVFAEKSEVLVQCANGQQYSTIGKTIMDSRSPSLWFYLSNFLRNHIEHAISELPNSLQPWMKMLILGELAAMGRDEIDAFKATGLFHILVISGSHISMIAGCGATLMFLLLRIPYCFRIINSYRFLGLLNISNLCIASFIFVFASCVCMSAAVQRASLLFLCRYLVPTFFANSHWHRPFVWSMAAQIFLFPLSVNSAGNFMSWLAHAIVILSPSNYLFTWKFFAKNFAGQSSLFFLGAWLFGNWAPLGIIINPALVDVFAAMSLGGFCLILLSFVGLQLPSIISLQLARAFEEFTQVQKTVAICFPIHQWLNEWSANQPMQAAFLAATGFTATLLVFVTLNRSKS